MVSACPKSLQFCQMASTGKSSSDTSQGQASGLIAHKSLSVLDVHPGKSFFSLIRVPL
jgi:hypothetical protein